MLEESAFRLRRILLRWLSPITSFGVGILVGVIVNLFTSNDAVSFRHVLARVSDWSSPLSLLLLGAIGVVSGAWFCERALARYCARRRWEVKLAALGRSRTSPSIAPFASSAVSWGDNLTLQLCPRFEEGWRVDEIALRHVKGNSLYSLPAADAAPYEQFRDENKAARWFRNDNETCRLAMNPVSFVDAPELNLEVQRCRYSQVQFTNHRLATDHTRRQRCLQQAQDGEIPFANVLVVHMVVVTSDEHILATLSSTKKDYFGNCWSFSIEEQLRVDDLSNNNVTVHGRIAQWIDRALVEELGVTRTDYLVENVRALSVFIEGHNLNCGLCCVVRLSIDAATTGAMIAATLRQDYEFTNYNFYTFDQAVDMLRSPTLPLHPTSEYRLLLALNHLLTPPTLARRLFVQAGRH